MFFFSYIQTVTLFYIKFSCRIFYFFQYVYYMCESEACQRGGLYGSHLPPPHRKLSSSFLLCMKYNSMKFNISYSHSPLHN